MNRPPRRISIVVSRENEGRTVARILKQELGISESILRKIRVNNSGTYLDGAFCRTDTPALAGQTISIDLDPSPKPTSIQAEPGTLDIAYEDDDLLIINKKAGLVVHPSRGHRNNTLCNYVAYYQASKGERAVPHPVNRLDRETTGLVVFAKHAHAQNRLTAMLHTEGFERSYLALCEGLAPKHGTIDAPIARITDEYGSFGVREDGKRALTHFESLASTYTEEGPISLVRLALETGRTHQIRVHMSHLGHPLLGDCAYGKSSKLIDRPALHSWKLSICHPVSNERLSITAPIPSDMAAFAQELSYEDNSSWIT